MSSHVAPANVTPPAEGEAAGFDPFKLFNGWFDRLGQTPAWIVSATVHLLILFLLAGITHSVARMEERAEITSVIEPPPDLEQYAFKDATVVDQVGNDSPVNMVSPATAAATQVGEPPQEQFERQMSREFELSGTPSRDVIPQPAQMDFTASFTAAGTTAEVGGMEGAVDRITQEIASSLRENETTVVWLFDASDSMTKRREAVADRFQNIYAQLQEMGVLATKPEALETVAASYGKGWNLLTDKPVTDAGPVAEKIRQIRSDGTPLENVFTAIDEVTKRFLARRTKERRNMMVIVVTDERGDDYQNLESLITRLKRHGIPVYCSGNASPLGREKGYVSWTYEDGASEMLPVDQGPETVAPDLVSLPYWGGRAPEILSSGFGPYAMTRLCAETGGLYLITDDTAQRFDPLVMRNYSPDYRPIAVYEAELKRNLAKQALVKAAVLTQQSDQKNAIPMPQTVFPAESDVVLNRAITEAQKPMAIVDYHLQEVSTLLEAGERDRPKLDGNRWKAAFDLAMGRVLALRARAYGYNATLAEMRVAPKPFQTKGSNQWRLVPSDKITAGPAVKKLAERAEEYLSRVIDEHPGTPWADLAAREIATPMGWDWKEQNDLVVRFGPRAADPEQARLLLAEEEEKKKEMKPGPAPKQRPRPNL